MSFPTNYMALFNASAVALKAVDPQLKVGGPATAQLQHVTDFITHATEANIPFDFVSTHMYPTDPQCPGGRGQGKNWGPDCFNDNVKKLRASVDPKIPLYITEYNVGCCLGYKQHDTSGAAAFIFRTMDKLAGVPDILSWWTFSDVCVLLSLSLSPSVFLALPPPTPFYLPLFPHTRTLRRYNALQRAAHLEHTCARGHAVGPVGHHALGCGGGCFWHAMHWSCPHIILLYHNSRARSLQV